MSKERQWEIFESYGTPEHEEILVNAYYDGIYPFVDARFLSKERRETYFTELQRRINAGKATPT